MRCSRSLVRLVDRASSAACPHPSGVRRQHDGGWGTGPGGTGGDTATAATPTASAAAAMSARATASCCAASVRSTRARDVDGQRAAGRRADDVRPRRISSSTFVDQSRRRPVRLRAGAVHRGPFTIDKLPAWYGERAALAHGDYGRRRHRHVRRGQPRRSTSRTECARARRSLLLAGCPRGATPAECTVD